MTHIICGVDAASQSLKANIGKDGPALQVERSLEGVQELAAFCKQHGVTLVVLEATGGYEKLPFALLWEAGLPCAILNPRAVRRFAEAMGVLEKTDAIDARLIAWYAEVKRIQPCEPASAAQQQLRAFVARLRQLTQAKVVQMNQRRLVEDPVVRDSIDEVVALLRAQIRRFESQIATLLKSDPVWVALEQAFCSLKGVAGRTVACLMAELPEIGTVSNKAIAKLAGLAPIARDSGQHQGKRSVRGGRAGVRAILFVVAEVVRRHEADFAEFHRKLSQSGKPKKVIRVALARKLLVRLNAKAREARQKLAVPA